MSSRGRQLLPRGERQETILDGASKAFARQGFAQTSMDEVASASGITKLIVYRHFASKEVLYRAVLDRTFQRLARELAAGRQRAERGPGLRAVLRVGRSHPDALRLLLVHAPREPDFADYATRLHARVVDVVLRGTTIADPLFARWTAKLVVACVFEGVLNWLELGSPKRDEEFATRCHAGIAAMIDALRRDF